MEKQTEDIIKSVMFEAVQKAYLEGIKTGMLMYSNFNKNNK